MIDVLFPYLFYSLFHIDLLLDKPVVSRKSDTGSKGYPFLGSARGAKEAVDLFTRREFVDGQRAETRKQTHNNLPKFRPPKG